MTSKASLSAEMYGGPDCPADVPVVASWDSFDELARRAKEATRPWILFESAGPRAVAIGPLFGPGVCFECYVARRQANGADECVPPVASTRALVEAARAWIGAHGPEAFVNRQVVVEASGAWTLHHVLSLPTCPSCRMGEISGGLPTLVSERTGIVHRTDFKTGFEPGHVTCRAFGSRTDAFLDVQAINHGMATDRSSSAACTRAVGEAVERYCAAFVAEDVHPPAHHSELAGRVVRPSELGRPVGDDAMMRWVEVRSTNHNDSAWVPAGHVYIPYLTNEGEDQPGVQDSTGLAAGTSFDDAMEHALLEVIERDAFMRAWRARIPVHRVEAETDILGLHLAEVPSAVPVRIVTAFLESDVAPYCAVGIAARLSLSDAVMAAGREAVAVRVWLKEWLSSNPPMPVFPPRTLEDHARVHAVRPELRAVRSEWIEPELPPPVGQCATCWQEVAEALPECYYKDVTTSDVRAAGVHVVRAVVPSFIRLDHDALHPALHQALRPSVYGVTVPHPLA